MRSQVTWTRDQRARAKKERTKLFAVALADADTRGECIVYTGPAEPEMIQELEAFLKKWLPREK